MKTTINEEFFEKWKDKKVVMWCKKEEYAIEFCKIMHEQGLKWENGKSYINSTYWYMERECTAYDFNNGLYCYTSWYKGQGYEILDFEDFIVEEETIDTTNNLPKHYDILGIDTMNLILTICEHNNTNIREGFYLANALKYLIRYNNKNKIDDLNKAKDYLDRLINEINRQGD